METSNNCAVDRSDAILCDNPRMVYSRACFTRVLTLFSVLNINVFDARMFAQCPGWNGRRCWVKFICRITGICYVQIALCCCCSVGGQVFVFLVFHGNKQAEINLWYTVESRIHQSIREMESCPFFSGLVMLHVTRYVTNVTFQNKVTSRHTL